MATYDARSRTLGDYDVDPGVAPAHDPSLFPGERFVRCADCGVTVPYGVNASGSICRALEELATVACGRFEIPSTPVGEHVPTITPEDSGRGVVCEACGRWAPIDGDRERVLEELAAIPCVDGLSHAELVDVVFSPGTFTPTLEDLGVDRWYGRDGRRHGECVRRVFRHERFQYTLFVRRLDDGTCRAAVHDAPAASREPLATLDFPDDDPAQPATRTAAARLVTFMRATDGMTAAEFGELKAAYDDAYESHRNAWLADAYRKARESFRGTLDGSPEAFADAFADGPDATREVLRRVVGADGFEDPGEAAFAREMLGRDHGFPGFVAFVADQHEWSPPVVEA